MDNKIKYKDIYISDIENVTIFHFSDSYLENEESVINSMSQFVEYVGYRRPKYVIIDKSAKAFNEINIISNYLRKCTDEIFDFGVRRILFVLDKERYNLFAGKKGYRNIEAFEDIESCLKTFKDDIKDQ